MTVDGADESLLSEIELTGTETSSACFLWHKEMDVIVDMLVYEIYKNKDEAETIFLQTAYANTTIKHASKGY